MLIESLIKETLISQVFRIVKVEQAVQGTVVELGRNRRYASRRGACWESPRYCDNPRHPPLPVCAAMGNQCVLHQCARRFALLANTEVKSWSMRCPK